VTVLKSYVLTLLSLSTQAVVVAAL